MSAERVRAAERRTPVAEGVAVFIGGHSRVKKMKQR